MRTVLLILLAIQPVVATAQEPHTAPLRAIHAKRWANGDAPPTSFEVRPNVYLTIEDGSASEPRDVVLVEECCYAWQRRRYLDRRSGRFERLLEQVAPNAARGALLQHTEHPSTCDDGYTEVYEQVRIDYSVRRCVEPKGLTYTVVRITTVTVPESE
jgi:hypothetical protein